MTQLALFSDPLPPVGWGWIDGQGFMHRVDKHEPLRSNPEIMAATCTTLQTGAVYRYSPDEYRKSLTNTVYPEPFKLKDPS